MNTITAKEFTEIECSDRSYELEDYETETPRWCKGCGDFGVLSVVQKYLQEKQVDPESVVCCSGIGCSSRLPHYMKTYGFHSIHGRALPVATGVALMRPDLQVLVVMGDGDCFSIGGNHWLHAARYNMNATVLVLDNEVYALTKKQVSPTTRAGTLTNTTPRGAYVGGLNPLSVYMGISNRSFLAQTATWLPGHLEKTFRAAWEHKGLSFVRVLQRCPVFMPDAFDAGGVNFPALFLDGGDEGIPVEKGFLKKSPTVKHDFTDVNAAQKIAQTEDMEPIGLIYKNTDTPTYQDIRESRIAHLSRSELVSKLNEEINKYSVQPK
ncbi:MAG: 2-oxoglutarate oxidoreductase [Gammaproteobacteria bacterium]|nr:2-oxoglutarate oxidoreductase [Gammaproteobacteria bacterium]